MANSQNTSRPIVQVYDKRLGIYVSTRKDGAITIGHFNEKGRTHRLDNK
jgi:hypothetical protein